MWCVKGFIIAPQKSISNMKETQNYLSFHY